MKQETELLCCLTLLPQSSVGNWFAGPIAAGEDGLVGVSSNPTFCLAMSGLGGLEFSVVGIENHRMFGAEGFLNQDSCHVGSLESQNRGFYCWERKRGWSGFNLASRQGTSRTRGEVLPAVPSGDTVPGETSPVPLYSLLAWGLGACVGCKGMWLACRHRRGPLHSARPTAHASPPPQHRCEEETGCCFQ